MNKSKNKSKANKSQSVDKTSEEISVTLKSKFGMQPGVYLTILYGVLLVVLLFTVLILPGIMKHGARVTFESIPEGAGIYIDGKRSGAAPKTVFIDSGIHTIKLKKPYFDTVEVKTKIPGRFFASLFFPKKVTITRSLQIKLDKADTLVRDTVEKMYEWALAETPTSIKHVPPLLAEAVNDLYNGGISTADANRLSEKLLENTIGFISSTNILKDYVNAWNLYHAEDKTAKENTYPPLTETIRDITKDNPSLFFAFLGILPEKESTAIKSAGWFHSLETQYRNAIKKPDITGNYGEKQLVKSDERWSLPVDNTVILNSVFIRVPEGGFTEGAYNELPDFTGQGEVSALPHSEQVESFYIARTEVTNAEWALFLAENPKWEKGNRSQLIEDGLVDKQYLEYWDSNLLVDMGTYPVQNISLPAAKAYCNWLEGYLPDAMRDYTVELPDETKWEYAAQWSAGFTDMPKGNISTSSLNAVGNSDDNNVPLKDMYGNVWEWTNEPYATLAPYTSNFGELFGNPDIDVYSVRGGAWANSSSSVTLSTRGMQKETWCTRFTGFRPVLIEE